MTKPFSQDSKKSGFKLGPKVGKGVYSGHSKQLILWHHNLMTITPLFYLGIIGIRSLLVPSSLTILFLFSSFMFRALLQLKRSRLL